MTPLYRFNSGSQGYEESQNWRKRRRSVIRRVKICLEEEGLGPVSQSTAVLIVRINDLDF